MSVLSVPVLFIDEIHRLNRQKQDSFLEAVENGDIILTGATTENPYFSLQPALRSRVLIFELFALDKQNLKNILHRAIQKDSVLSTLELSIEPGAEEYLIERSSDPRNMLTILETAVLNKGAGSNIITKDDIADVAHKMKARSELLTCTPALIPSSLRIFCVVMSSHCISG